MSNPDKEEFRQINRSWCFRSAPHWQYFTSTTRQGLCCHWRCDSARWRAKSLLKALLRNTNDLRSTHLKAVPEYNELQHPQKQQFLQQPRVQKSSWLIQKIPIFEADPGFFLISEGKVNSLLLGQGTAELQETAAEDHQETEWESQQEPPTGWFFGKLREKNNYRCQNKSLNRKKPVKV